MSLAARQFDKIGFMPSFNGLDASKLVLMTPLHLPVPMVDCLGEGRVSTSNATVPIIVIKRRHMNEEMELPLVWQENPPDLFNNLERLPTEERVIDDSKLFFKQYKEPTMDLPESKYERCVLNEMEQAVDFVKFTKYEIKPVLEQFAEQVDVKDTPAVPSIEILNELEPDYGLQVPAEVPVAVKNDDLDVFEQFVDLNSAFVNPFVKQSVELKQMPVNSPTLDFKIYETLSEQSILKEELDKVTQFRQTLPLDQQVWKDRFTSVFKQRTLPNLGLMDNTRFVNSSLLSWNIRKAITEFKESEFDFESELLNDNPYTIKYGDLFTYSKSSKDSVEVELPINFTGYVTVPKSVVVVHEEPTSILPIAKKAKFDPASSIEHYLHLIGKKQINSTKPPPANPKKNPVNFSSTGSNSNKSDDVVLNKNVIAHKYLISTSLLLKRDLVKAIEELNVILYERDFPQETLVIDTKTIMLFLDFNSTMKLTNYDEFLNSDLAKLILTTATHYMYIHLVFTGTTEREKSVRVYPFTPPTVKWITIMNEFGVSVIGQEFGGSLKVWFTSTDAETASIIQASARRAKKENNPNQWLLRDWMTENETRHERFLSKIPGCNNILAQLMLSDYTLAQLLSFDYGYFIELFSTWTCPSRLVQIAKIRD